MHVKLSSSASWAIAKCVPCINVCETEELICDSDSVDHFVSNVTGIGAVDDLSEDSDNSVPTDKVWCEHTAKMHQCSARKPGVNRCAAPHINADCTSVDYFRLIVTNEPLNIILVESNHY
jgi:hypothetical protein